MTMESIWESKEDSILAEITLKHFRNGSYELKAFNEAAERLGRTVSSCWSRWNSEVRREYEEAIESAKFERMQRLKM